ncbi:hypothetical protein KDAU_31150 [Dictyobacter aurantiacus]|uniref:Uncharacterized protein n=1 Tax=Dictyobacter aurantiacus TaxID=1936993 RepID=A0A401ZG23_9CHLR|nr:hypothetical protein KDAU_31150 [Dictyobacter aurantiacus]
MLNWLNYAENSTPGAFARLRYHTYGSVKKPHIGCLFKYKEAGAKLEEPGWMMEDKQNRGMVMA